METVLPQDTEIVGEDSIEINVVKNISEMTVQIMSALGVTQERLTANLDYYGQATTALSLTVLALITASGGDYSLPMPPIEEFHAILSRIAEQNAYSVEYESTGG